MTTANNNPNRVRHLYSRPEQPTRVNLARIAVCFFLGAALALALNAALVSL